MQEKGSHFTILVIWEEPMMFTRHPERIDQKSWKWSLVEMKRCKSNGLCCGAGGAQMFKEAEKGDKEIFVERTEEALETAPDLIATGCPFCNTMMTDGIKNKEKEKSVSVMDIAELIAHAKDL